MKNTNCLRITVTLFLLATFLFVHPKSFATIKKNTKKTQHFVTKRAHYQSMDGLLNLLYTIVKEKRSYWTNAQTTTSVLTCLTEECMELKEALKHQNYEKAKEEMGDIFGMTLQLGLIAERDGLFGFNEAALDQIEKIHRRAPYIFDPELDREVSNLTQAIELWYKIKRKERESSNQ